jgi:hypothetical protein
MALGWVTKHEVVRTCDYINLYQVIEMRRVQVKVSTKNSNADRDETMDYDITGILKSEAAITEWKQKTNLAQLTKNLTLKLGRLKRLARIRQGKITDYHNNNDDKSDLDLDLALNSNCDGDSDSDDFDLDKPKTSSDKPKPKHTQSAPAPAKEIIVTANKELPVDIPALEPTTPKANS